MCRMPKTQQRNEMWQIVCVYNDFSFKIENYVNKQEKNILYIQRIKMYCDVMMIHSTQ